MINARSPVIAISAPNRASGTVLQCAIAANVQSLSWATCPSSTSYTPASPLADGRWVFGLRLQASNGTILTGTQYRLFRVDNTVPDTAINSVPSTTSPNVDITATSPLTGARFECRLDGGEWVSCLATKRLTDLSVGSHTYAVRAIGGGGLADPTPATVTWSVVALDTTITGGPATNSESSTTSPTYTFTGTPSGVTFQCGTGESTTISNWSPCASPWSVPAQPDGSTFVVGVRAVDATGTVDASPDLRLVRIEVPKLTVATPQASELNVRLSQEQSFGTSLDWVQWRSTDLTTVTRKNTTTPLIAAAQYFSGPTTQQPRLGNTVFDWTDAAGATPSGSTPQGVSVSGYYKGFTVKVDGSTSRVRRVRLHLGVVGATTTGLLRATLPGQATVDKVVGPTGRDVYNVSVTITFKPDAAGQLTLRWTQDSSNADGGVVLFGANVV